MNEFIKNILGDFEMEVPTFTPSQLTDVQNKLGLSFPNDYISFMQEINGGEGEVGDNSYLILFALETLPEINEAYKILLSQIPGYVLIGKDAADTGYAINKEDKKYYSFGLMSDFKKDSIDFCGSNFTEFITHLHNA